jgi:hypothetical protein
MKIKLNALIIGLALLAANHPAAAQNAQFFRLVGPTKTTITKFKADGTLVWSNATPGATDRWQSKYAFMRIVKI